MTDQQVIELGGQLLRLSNSLVMCPAGEKPCGLCG